MTGETVFVEDWTGGKAVGFIPKTIFYKDETGKLNPPKEVLFFMDFAEGIDPEFASKVENYRYRPDKKETWLSQDYDARCRLSHMKHPEWIGRKSGCIGSPMSWKELGILQKEKPMSEFATPVPADAAVELLKQSGAVLDGHFCLTRKAAPPGKPDGWFHSPGYVNKAMACARPTLAYQLAVGMAQPFVSTLPTPFVKKTIDAVVCPAVGAITLGSYVSRIVGITINPNVAFVYTERKGEGNAMSLERGFGDLVAGKNVLVVEDIVSSGGSVIETVEAVKAAKGSVVAVTVLWNRGGAKAREEVLSHLAEDGMFFSLIQKEIETYYWTDCPLCAAGVPLDKKVGKANDFLKDLSTLTLLTLGSEEKNLADRILAANSFEKEGGEA